MILVTGGTGLVGSHLLLELAVAGDRVRAIHRRNSSFEGVKKVFAYGRSAEESQRLYSSISWVEADILEVPALVPAFEDITAVYHCAALVSFDSSDNKKLRKINIEGTANVVNLSIEKQVKKLCYVSSIATLDLKIGQEKITEESYWNKELNHGMYSISKYGAEMEIWRASQEGVPVVIVNPGVIIGPGFWNTGSGILFKRIWKGFSYTFPKITGFVGVQDVVKALHLLMESTVRNEEFILVSENMSFRNILEITAKSLGKPVPARELKPWMIRMGRIGEFLLAGFGRPRHLKKDSSISLFSKTYYDSSKFKFQFGFKFEKMETVITETGKAFKEEFRK